MKSNNFYKHFDINFFVLLLILCVIVLSCNYETNKEHNSKFNTMDVKYQNVIKYTAAQLELDKIYSLLSYAIVLKYWESNDRNGRGYNVGAILVDENNDVVDWDINSVNITENSTQHGEMRLISRYLNKDNLYSLKGYTIYPTLEPCAMCGGMMAMVSIKRTVNGQKDYYFSKALERLSFDSRSIGGYEPYPRIVISEETPSDISDQLDNAYLLYIDKGNKPIITKFLSTDLAKNIFEQAKADFLSYVPKHQENTIKLKKAQSFYHLLPEKYNHDRKY